MVAEFYTQQKNLLEKDSFTKVEDGREVIFQGDDYCVSFSEKTWKKPT